MIVIKILMIRVCLLHVAMFAVCLQYILPFFIENAFFYQA